MYILDPQLIHVFYIEKQNALKKGKKKKKPKSNTTQPVPVCYGKTETKSIKFKQNSK